MEKTVLLAKSPREQEAPRFEETLAGHTEKVVESFDVLFGPSSRAPTRLAERWLAFFMLPESAMEAFIPMGRFACGVHDAGKGNDLFQDMLHRTSMPQAIRHEHLSALFLWLPEISRWMDSFSNIDRRIVACAVAGHHLRCKREDFARPLDADIKAFRIHDGLGGLFQNIGSVLGASFQPRENPFQEARWGFDGRGGFDVRDLRDRVEKDLHHFHRKELKRDPFLRRLLMAVRAALIQADSSGSGLVRENKELRSWLETAFGSQLSESDIQEKVISPRVGQIERARGRFAWSDFQEASETLARRALLLAPCGSGKTLAAWRWIKARLRERPAARVIFLYPTRATATEGFRDYVSWAPEADASLLTGTAAYELEGMFENPDDEKHGKDFTTEERLYALGFWQRRIFSATVDQFLGFMQQVYKSVCLLPLLADSVVVIDEVHSFDRNLFSVLKRFLANFDVPVLCMTASLPPVRRKELEDECGLQVFPRDMDDFPDLQMGAAMPRYRVSLVEDEEHATAAAMKAMDEGRRVLWVVNTVARCQRLARTMGALCYHSRFKLEDRKGRHEAVIQAFREGGNPVLAVTTQVCEMSLDLDADLLISEAAPITAMIQRMGRCNRHAAPGGGKIGDALFYKPEDNLPYSDEDLRGAEAFLGALNGSVASQYRLEELLERLGPDVFEPERYAAFLENGAWAASREAALRDSNDFSVTAILSGDIPRYFELRSAKSAIDGLYLPVPRKFAQVRPRLGAFPQVADSAHYDPLFGFFDHPLEVIL